MRPLLGSVLLLGGILLVNACGPSEKTRKPEKVSRTLRLTAVDSLSGEPLDSARAVNRTFGDSLRTDSAGQFVLRDAKPALYVFDVGGYGYHTQRHFSALVEPDDSTVSVSTDLLRQRLTIDCKNSRPYFWGNFVQQYKKDTTQVRMQLSNVLARDGKVKIRPVVANDLSSPIFLPDNFGALGHYEVLLYDGNSTPIRYTYKDAPPDQGHRIYSKGDILPIVPKDIERMDQSVLVVGDSIEEGTTIWARMRYTFSPDDTLEATSATPFPKDPVRGLDSLQTPVFDTLRTAGAVQVPDSLVIQRDTTTVEVVGIDTTVTRQGYVLFSTLRDGNAAPTAKKARNLLYVPDSVIARARRDSLEAVAEARETVPEIDTASLSPSEIRSPLQIVERTDTAALRSLLKSNELVRTLSNGLPPLDMTADSLLSFSRALRRGAYLQMPSLSRARGRQGLDTKPDSVQADSIILSAPASDSLFRLLTPDTLAASDTLAPSDTSAPLAAANPFVTPDPSARLAPDTDSITVDSLRLTVGPDADSVTTTPVVTSTLSNPPTYSYWYASSAQSRTGTPLFIADPSFFRLRARAHVDTSAAVSVDGLLPDRIGLREQIALNRYPQQVIRAPAGTYRREYLKTWKLLQENSLKRHYCDIFPFPIQTEWTSVSMQ